MSLSCCGPCHTPELWRFVQMEGFGSAGLLTAAEEKKLGRQLQELLVLEDVKHKALNRLGRQISSAEWMELCEITDAKAFKKTVRVGPAVTSEASRAGHGACNRPQSRLCCKSRSAPATCSRLIQLCTRATCLERLRHLCFVLSWDSGSSESA